MRPSSPSRGDHGDFPARKGHQNRFYVKALCDHLVKTVFITRCFTCNGFNRLAYKMIQDEGDLYRFNLHGSIVFDQFDAVSCLPAKGIFSLLKIILSNNAFFTEERRQRVECSTILKHIFSQEHLMTVIDSEPDKEQEQASGSKSAVPLTLSRVKSSTDQPATWIVPLQLTTCVLREFLSLSDTLLKPLASRPSVPAMVAKKICQLKELRSQRLSACYEKLTLPSQHLPLITSSSHASFAKQVPVHRGGPQTESGTEVSEADVSLNTTDTPLKESQNKTGYSMPFKRFHIWSRKIEAMARPYYTAKAPGGQPTMIDTEQDSTPELTSACDPPHGATEVAELNHAVDFLQQATCYPYGNQATHTAHSPGGLQEFLVALMWFLKEVEQELCVACVLLMCVSKRDLQQFQQEAPFLLNFSMKISSLLPLDFRNMLSIPTLIVPHACTENAVLMKLACHDGVTNAVIAPIAVAPGDHIYRDICEKGSLKHITHHGIYMGNGRVINFSGNELSLRGLLLSAPHAKIRVTSLINFLVKGSRLRIQRYAECDPPSVTLVRAERALVDQTFPAYHMFKNNCEHFCHYCKTGVPRSEQVEKGIKYAGIASAIVTAAVCVGVTAALKKR